MAINQHFWNLELDNNKKLNDYFDEINEILNAGWYVCSGQRKRYLKSIIKDNKGYFVLYCKYCYPSDQPFDQLS